MNKFLYPFSVLYDLASKADRHFTKSKYLDKPVVSVGNITWGGSGKTPIVIELLETLLKNNLNPAVLTRGYARKEAKPILLKKDGAPASVLQTGDEPLLIFKSVPDANVIIGAKRYDNALRFKKEINPDVYVLDDGFQHWKIQRDLDIVCLNAANPFGNGMIIPAGILRESPKALKRAGLIIITNSDMVPSEVLGKLQKEIFEISGKDSLTTYYGDYKYKQINLHDNFDTGKLKDNDVYILSGVGFAKGFRSSVEKSGIKVKGSFVLPDHAKYDKKTINSIFDKTGSAYIIITAKDAVKIAYFTDDIIKEKTAVLTVKPVFKTGKEQWEKIILKSLRCF
ncbi:MAG: tetraacyldisaccharide 4'-kinase [Endomicrobium sp.]|nr:tetraacyldisaccharide 4'-kinase [Endomicrobium sp.]